MNRDLLIYGGAALAAVALLWWVKKKGVAGVTAALTGAAADAGTGVVLGLGDAVGLPRTSLTECEKAQAEGRWWDASFLCPAKDFLAGGWDAMTGKDPTPAPQGAFGESGIPYRPGWQLPDPFNYDVGYIYQ